MMHVTRFIQNSVSYKPELRADRIGAQQGALVRASCTGTTKLLRTTLARIAMLCLLSRPKTLTRCSWLVTSRWLVQMLLLDRTSPINSSSATAHLPVVRQLRVLVEGCLVVAVVVVLLVTVLSDVGQALRPKVAMLRWVRTSKPTDRRRIIVMIRITTQPTLPIVVRRRSAKSTTTCDKIVTASALIKCVTATHSARHLRQDYNARSDCAQSWTTDLFKRSPL